MGDSETHLCFTISASVLVAAPSLHLAAKADGGPIYPLVYWTESIGSGLARTLLVIAEITHHVCLFGDVKVSVMEEQRVKIFSLF